jgi:ABC-type amino acid transport substrate-binding protein
VSALPDPPFEVAVDGGQTGFDGELMRLICEHLGLSLRPVPYSGDGASRQPTKKPKAICAENQFLYEPP